MKRLLLFLLTTVPVWADERPKYQPTADELRRAYEQADRLGAEANGRVLNMNLTPVWRADRKSFGYRRELPDGQKEFIAVEVTTGKKSPLFDHDRLATSLAKAANATIDARRLPFNQFEFAKDDAGLLFVYGNSQWKVTFADYECTKVGPAPKPPVPKKRNNASDSEDDDLDAPQPRPKKDRPNPAAPTEYRSPDGQWTATIRDYNVYLQGKDQKEAKPVTTNGTANNYYGNLSWAPNSQRFTVFRIEPGDRFEVTYLQSSPPEGGRAKVSTQVYPLPGDKFTAYEPYVVEVATAKVINVEAERIDFRFPRVRWHKDGNRFTYEKTDRGHQRFRVIEVDARSGKTRAIYDDHAKTFVNQYNNFYIRYLDNTNEIIVSSERDGWNRLYLIDAVKGEIKNALMQGDYVFRGVEDVDEQQRTLVFRACGRNIGQDPYFIHYYRVRFDGTQLTPLTEGDGTHTLSYSPDKQIYVDTYSRVDMPPVHELRRTSDGKLITLLERADASALNAVHLSAPEVFVAKGRDGKTDIWGIVTRPRHFDPKKKYPIIEYIYAGPHDSHVPKSYRPFSGRQSLAEFGFIVVQCDGMGTCNRSKAFHDVCWKNVGDAGFPDRIAWIKALATKYPYMDTSRVGIYGTSAGGQSSTGALLFHGDFYKVAVSACGCHDNRMDKSSWNEQWMGYPVGPHYAAQSNITNAHKLTGKLLLIVGEMDTNVPPESTYRLADALIKARKDFDFLMVPGMGHSDGGPYGERRRRDFFVRHLHGVQPPDWNATK